MSLQTQPTVAGTPPTTPSPPPSPAPPPPRSPGDICRFLLGSVTKCCLDTGGEHIDTDTVRGPDEAEKEKSKTIQWCTCHLTFYCAWIIFFRISIWASGWCHPPHPWDSLLVDLLHLLLLQKDESWQFRCLPLFTTF